MRCNYFALHTTISSWEVYESYAFNFNSIEESPSIENLWNDKPSHTHTLTYIER